MPKRLTIITNLLELLGLVLIVVGIYVALGLAFALVTAGLALIGLSYLLATRGGRQ